jgi:hypothetical protein
MAVIKRAKASHVDFYHTNAILCLGVGIFTASLSIPLFYHHRMMMIGMVGTIEARIQSMPCTFLVDSSTGPDYA